MARLIKHHNTPRKHLLMQSLAVVKANCVLPLAYVAEQRDRREKVQKEMTHARKLVREYCAQKAAIIKESKARGHDRAERALITEILVSCAHFLFGLSDEAAAIDHLARKIAANITNRPDIFELRQALKEHSPQSLMKMMRVAIAAPKEHLCNAKPHLEYLASRFQVMIDDEVNEQDNAVLRISVADLMATRDFNPASLCRILKNLATRLEKFDQAAHNKNVNPA